MVYELVYEMPSRCGCGAPLSMQDGRPWCGGCGPVRFAQFDKAKHPRGKDGKFGGGGQNAGKPPTAADTDPTIQRAMKYLTQEERDNMPRIVLQPKRPEGVSDNVEGYHVPGYPAIYVGTWSETWHHAVNGEKDGEQKLAGILIHEATHVTGGDEDAAYSAQIAALRRIGASELIIERVEKAKRSVLAKGTKR